MKLGFVVLYVPDVRAAAAFYQQAFGLAVRDADPDDRYMEMDTGETTLAFAAESLIEQAGRSFRPHRPHERPAAGEFSFVADDVAAAYETALKAGAVSYEPPSQRPDGVVVAYVRDLNGVLVEIRQAVERHADDAWRHALRG